MPGLAMIAAIAVVKVGMGKAFEVSTLTATL